MAVMLVERYWEDTFAFRVTRVSDQCEAGYCIVTLLYCHTSADEKLHKMRKMCNFSFQPENYNNLLRKTLVKAENLLSLYLSTYCHCYCQSDNYLYFYYIGK